MDFEDQNIFLHHSISLEDAYAEMQHDEYSSERRSKLESFVQKNKRTNALVEMSVGYICPIYPIYFCY